MNSTLSATPSTKTLNPSTDPILAIDAVAYEGQPAHMRMYRLGYENYMAMMPKLEDNNPNLQDDLKITEELMGQLGHAVATSDWLYHNQPEVFDRTILAIEDVPVAGEGAELIVARWGNGFSSPVHGHSDGFLYENILHGMMRVNTYRITDQENGIVRPVSTTIAKDGVFLSTYSAGGRDKKWKRDNYVHNFTSIGQSATLHYIPEHTRDGRDNKFKVEYFDDSYPLEESDVTRIDSLQAMYLIPGEVVLVRSTNVPEYGDHYIVITGKPVVKEHGLRPEEVAIHAPNNRILDNYEMQTGLTLLKLNDEAKQMFHAFHGITVKDNIVHFPEA